MKRLTKKQIAIELMNSYDSSIYFIECTIFIQKFSPDEFAEILRQEVYCKGLIKQLNKMLSTFERMEAYEYCQVIYLYLQSNINTYLY